MKDIRKNSKGITLIMLIIIIVILIIISGVTINSSFSDEGLVKSSREAKFKMEASSYKELEYNRQALINKQDIENIYTLKKTLNDEITTLENGIKQSEDTISMITTADGDLSVIQEILQGIISSLTKISNSDGDINNIKVEINQWIQEIDSIANNAEFGGTKLLDGTLEYVLNFGSKSFEQGTMQIKSENMSWKNLYGDEELDYNNMEQTMEKARNALKKVSIQKSEFGAKQNAININIDYLKELKENINELVIDIYGDGTTNVNEEKSIEIANSYNTTLNFINTAEASLGIIGDNLQKMKELIVKMANSSTTSELDRTVIQSEVNARIAIIELQLNNTKITNKKLLKGDLPFLQELTIEKLKIDNLSVSTQENAKSSLEKIDDALDIISEERSNAGKIQNDILKRDDYKTAKAEHGYAFNIKKQATMPVTDEKINDRFSLKDGILYYTGNDEMEKKWAQDLNILIQ